MRRIFSVLAVVALLAAMMIGAPGAMAQEETCSEVLHFPSDDPTKGEVITVGDKAAAKHVAQHGDILLVQGVPCPVEEEPLPEV